MKWKGGRTTQYYTNWHKWFAWYPITIFESDGRKVKLWLEYVERKGQINYAGIYYISYYCWEYRII